MPGVLGVAQDSVDGLSGPPFSGRGGVTGRVGVEPGGDGGHAELADDPPGEDLLDHRGALRVQGQAGLGAALGGLGRDRALEGSERLRRPSWDACPAKKRVNS